MQDNVRTPLERAVASINRAIAADIRSAGEKNLSMGLLVNAFSSAIYGFVEKAGTQTQLSILSDPALHGVSMAGAELDGRDVASVIASTLREALNQRLRPKMIEMCRHIHKDNTLDTFASISSVLERASLENDPTFDHEALRAVAAFAGSVGETGLSAGYREHLQVLPEALKSLTSRRKDKAFIARMGEPLERIVRLADRAADLVHLDSVDPQGFKSSVDREMASRHRASRSMAA